MFTLSQILDNGQRRLLAAGISTARLDMQILAEKVLFKDRSWLIAHQDMVLSSLQRTRLWELVEKRCQRLPIAYVVKQKEFYGLSLAVDESVLIPRPETEAIVEHVILHAPHGSHLLDVGTGSGAIAIAVKYNRPDMYVTASDFSVAALEIARKNARRHWVCMELRHSNMFQDITATYDVITANLPYLPTDQELPPDVRHEPATALLSGQDGLKHYREFFTAVQRHLSADGIVFTESDRTQHAALGSLATGFEQIILSPFVNLFRRQ